MSASDAAFKKWWRGTGSVEPAAPFPVWRQLEEHGRAVSISQQIRAASTDEAPPPGRMTTMPPLRNDPHKGNPHSDAWEAWWYENTTSIDVYMRDKEKGITLSATISRRSLEAWLKRTKVSEKDNKE